MRNNCIAVMDLGTNTFHLMIAEVTDGTFTEIAHDFEAVRLGEGGMSKGYIQESAFNRGIATMERFSRLIAKHNAKPAKAMATSALRNAANGRQFIDTVQDKTGIQIELITGLQEATYIYEGIKASGALKSCRSLIMDIGGGSVEFIICTPEDILWKHSFEIGAARLIERFHQVDPIPQECIHALNTYLNETLGILVDAANQYGIDELIGSAGAFETFVEVTELEKRPDFNIKQIKSYEFDLNTLIPLTDRLIASSNQQRRAMKGIIPIRVDMIVAASIITRYVMNKLNIGKVSMSTYSLKEGVMAGLASQLL